MTKLNYLRIALALAVVLLLCCASMKPDVGLAQTPTPPPTPTPSPTPKPAQYSCTATTDEALVSAILEKIKADTRFDDQHRHIVVSSSKRIVTLRGWTKGREQADALIQFARMTACVRKVISKDLRAFRSNGGCIAGQKQCGDICIPRDEACNILP